LNNPRTELKNLSKDFVDFDVSCQPYEYSTKCIYSYVETEKTITHKSLIVMRVLPINGKPCILIRITSVQLDISVKTKILFKGSLQKATLALRGRLHVRFCVRIGVRFGVRFAAKSVP
jgi:hypothetical protein